MDEWPWLARVADIVGVGVVIAAVLRWTVGRVVERLIDAQKEVITHIESASENISQSYEKLFQFAEQARQHEASEHKEVIDSNRRWGKAMLDAIRENQTQTNADHGKIVEELARISTRQEK